MQDYQKPSHKQGHLSQSMMHHQSCYKSQSYRIGVYPSYRRQSHSHLREHGQPRRRCLQKYYDHRPRSRAQYVYSPSINYGYQSWLYRDPEPYHGVNYNAHEFYYGHQFLTRFLHLHILDLGRPHPRLRIGKFHCVLQYVYNHRPPHANVTAYLHQ